MCGETLSELDGEIAISEKHKKSSGIFERTGTQLQNWSFVRFSIFPVSRHFRRKGTDLAIGQGYTVMLLAKKHLLCCDYKPTDTPEQALTQTDINVLPRAPCSETKVTPLWHMALPCRGARARPGTAGVAAGQGHQEVFHAGPPELRSASSGPPLCQGNFTAPIQYWASSTWLT